MDAAKSFTRRKMRPSPRQHHAVAPGGSAVFDGHRDVCPRAVGFHRVENVWVVDQQAVHAQFFGFFLPHLSFDVPRATEGWALMAGT